MNGRDSDPQVPRISRVEERERLLAETLAHAEALEEQYKVIPADLRPRGRWKSPAALIVMASAAFLFAFPPAWVAGPPLAVPTPGDLDRGLRASMWLQAQQVEAFRLREGRLPDDLGETGSSFADLTLVRSNSRVFQIRGRRADGSVLLYDSGSPSPGFEAAAGWLRAPP